MHTHVQNKNTCINSYIRETRWPWALRLLYTKTYTRNRHRERERESRRTCIRTRTSTRIRARARTHPHADCLAHTRYGPFTPGFVAVPHCCEYRGQWPGVSGVEYGVRAANEIERVILEQGPDECGALVIEAITAGGGVITPPEGYMERVQEICSQYGLLIIVDEVVMGLGRSGRYTHASARVQLPAILILPLWLRW